MPLSVKKTYFNDCVFNVWENVYEPAEDSFLFAENLDIQEGNKILEIGTGCGILGILAAKKAKIVVAVDINFGAVSCARINARLNNVQNKIFYLQGDLFAPLRESYKFDVILFNAPYLPVEENEKASWIGRAWNGGVTGRQVIDRFIAKAPNHLRPKGRVLLMQSTLANFDETLQRFLDHGINAIVIAKLALPFFETIMLLEAKI